MSPDALYLLLRDQILDRVISLKGQPHLPDAVRQPVIADLDDAERLLTCWGPTHREPPPEPPW